MGRIRNEAIAVGLVTLTLLLAACKSGGGDGHGGEGGDPAAPESILLFCDDDVEFPVTGNWPAASRLEGDGWTWHPYLCLPDGDGGFTFVRNQAPPLKPMRTRYDSRHHTPGALSLRFKEGTGVAWVDGAFVSAHRDLPCVEAVMDDHGDEFAGVYRSIPGDRAELDRERIELMRNAQQFLADRTLFFRVRLESDEHLVDIAEALNRCPTVAGVEPVDDGVYVE